MLMTPFKIVAFTGRKWSGKSTSATIAKRLIGDSAIRMSFAAPIREAVSKIYDRPLDDIKEAIRPVMQTVGDSFKVLHGDGYFIETLANRWLMADKRFTTLIIDDVRTKEEAEWVHKNEGVLIRIKRPGNEDRNDQHITEALIDTLPADLEIVNNNTLEHLGGVLKEVLIDTSNENKN